MIQRICKWLTRVSGTVWLLVLPIGYYPDSPDSTRLVVGAHGGIGQMATVLRDCSGNPIASSASGFEEVAYSAYVMQPPYPWVLGVRGGTFGSDYRPVTHGGYSTREWVTFSYVNPNISLETRYVGTGFGLVLGRMPRDLDEDGRLTFTSHIRLGDIERGYFMMSVAENTPLISGGSWFDFGIGYKASPMLRGFTGFSAGMYDQVGVLQQLRLRLHRTADLDLALRVGGADGHFEGSLAAGLNVRVWSARSH